MRVPLALLAAVCASTVACRDPAPKSDPAPTADPPPTPAEATQAKPADAAPPPPTIPPGERMAFAAACTDGERAVVAAVGDVLVHHELQRQAVASPKRFRVLWAAIADLLAGADVTYANLEGVIAPGLAWNARKVPDPGFEFDEVVYTGYPRFNYHPHLAEDLRSDGVDVVSTANNHVFDRDLPGIDTTIEWLRKAGVKLAGTRHSDDGDKGGYAVTEAGPLTIGWIACAAFTNRFKDLDTDQVIRCDPKDDDTVLAQIRELAGRDSIDAVIVTPHWGKPYTRELTKRQTRLAHDWLDAGATAVIGNHPHVLQRFEKYETKDGRETFVVYSLGNFVSHQPQLPRRSTALLYLGLTRDADGVTRVNGVRYVPLHVRQTGDEFFVEAIDRVDGPADARDHISDVLPPGNAIGPDERVITNPECWQ